MNPSDPAEFCEDVRGRLVAALLLRYGPSRSPCPAPDVFEIELSEPIGNRSIVAAPSSMTVRLSPGSAPVEPGVAFTMVYDPAGLGDGTTIGDHVMIQSVDDPSVQIQVGGVFSDDLVAGPPSPIVQDRWSPTGEARLIVPGGTPAGDYTIMFIDHPQFNGLITVG